MVGVVWLPYRLFMLKEWRCRLLCGQCGFSLRGQAERVRLAKTVLSNAVVYIATRLLR